MLKASEIIEYVKKLAPEDLAEFEDPVGLHTGSMETTVERAGFAVDVSRSVLQQAIETGVQLLITHHPLIFRPLSRLTSDSSISSRVVELIKHDITLYCAHTNLDRATAGNNQTLAELLELSEIEQIISVDVMQLSKIVVFVPSENADRVAQAMGDAGAGSIDNYSHCSFQSSGKGVFLPLEGSDPYIGESGELTAVEETRLEMVCPEHAIADVIGAMKSVHPYEEPAYDIYTLENTVPGLGMGRIGNRKLPCFASALAEEVGRKLKVQGLRVYGDSSKVIGRVAVCSGAGSSFYADAIKHRADAFITGDVKHHDAVDAEYTGLVIIDAGHFETEKPGIMRLAEAVRTEFAESGLQVDYLE